MGSENLQYQEKVVRSSGAREGDRLSIDLLFSGEAHGAINLPSRTIFRRLRGSRNITGVSAIRERFKIGFSNQFRSVSMH